MTDHAWVDNEGSFAGLYGLQNPIVSWLIGRGMGELVALRPADMHEAATGPTCGAPREGYGPSRPGGRAAWHRLPGKCGAEMRYRAEGWACYEHKQPKRRPRAPLLQGEPEWIDFGGGPVRLKSLSPQALLALASRTVDVVYQSDGGGRPFWRYVVR